MFSTARYAGRSAAGLGKRLPHGWKHLFGLAEAYSEPRALESLRPKL
jgi:hypothetical protein